ncbi:type II toxin-antitoxin system prevent-host-death family antitoxin [Nocardioides endophyticus]|uniref:type II toxin-antitoxin system Phd/YefM family antitoxin n=1 Tax=Nocardioides endophyticus TaxID=1353775 RepID=UPI0031E54F83
MSHRELRTRSDEVLRAVEAGESFTVTDGGVPIARLGPVADPPPDLRRVHPARRRGGFSVLPRVTLDVTVRRTLDALRDERG